MKRHLTYIMLAALAFLPASAGAIDLGQVIGSAVGGVQQLAQAAKEITPSEEHYIGRAVAAMIVAKYPLYDSPALTKYLNDVGLLVAYASDRPTTYGGYHFAVLASDEPNAYACPGGIILVNKGLLKEVKDEDQLAAILGHEVAHVSHRHGIGAIKKDRWTKFAFYAAAEVGKQYTSDEIGQLVGEFQGVVSDVAKKVMESGYSKGDEKNADENGMKFAYAAGYNPAGMIDFIKAEDAKGIGSTKGPFSSHPKPDVRIKELEKELSDLGGATTDPSRTARFKSATASVK